MEWGPDEPERSGPRKGEGRGRSQLRAKDILTPKQYRNYRHGRALSALFAAFGFSWVAIGAMQLAAPTAGASGDALSWEVWAGFVAFGLCGMIGGIAGCLGSRAWSRFGFVFAAAFVFACGAGTIVTLLWLLGRSRHMAAVDLVRKARTEDA